MSGPSSGNGDTPPSPNVRRGPPSGRSMSPSFVRFYNRTQRSVDVIWLNYEGLGVKYRSLGPQQWLDVNTFVGHPWIFRDSETGDRLVAQFQEVYEPQVDTREGPPRRRIVAITLPVFSLRERCLQVIRALVPQRHVCQLEIPHTLQRELQHGVSECDISMATNNNNNTTTLHTAVRPHLHVNQPAAPRGPGYHGNTQPHIHPSPGQGVLLNGHHAPAATHQVRPRLENNSSHLARMLTALPHHLSTTVTTTTTASAACTNTTGAMTCHSVSVTHMSTEPSPGTSRDVYDVSSVRLPHTVYSSSGGGSGNSSDNRQSDEQHMHQGLHSESQQAENNSGNEESTSSESSSGEQTGDDSTMDSSGAMDTSHDTGPRSP